MTGALTTITENCAALCTARHACPSVSAERAGWIPHRFPLGITVVLPSAVPQPLQPQPPNPRVAELTEAPGTPLPATPSPAAGRSAAHLLQAEVLGAHQQRDALPVALVHPDGAHNVLHHLLLAVERDGNVLVAAAVPAAEGGGRAAAGWGQGGPPTRAECPGQHCRSQQWKQRRGREQGRRPCLRHHHQGYRVSATPPPPGPLPARLPVNLACKQPLFPSPSPSLPRSLFPLTCSTGCS